MDVIKTDIFDKWLRKLKDIRATALIQVNIDRIIEGNIGVVKSLGEGVHEKKIQYGPGYRLYFMNSGQHLILLLCGGTKSSQQADIQKAKMLAQLWKGKK